MIKDLQSTLSHEMQMKVILPGIFTLFSQGMTAISSIEGNVRDAIVFVYWLETLA